MACPITWVIMGFIAVIAVITSVVRAFNIFGSQAHSIIGTVCGVVTTAAAFIGNVFVGLLSGMVQLLWTIFVEPFMGIIEWILNACNGGFDSLGGAVANLIGQIISWFLSLGKVVTTIIDAIFGSDWTSQLKSLQNDVLAWGKNENAIDFAAEMDPANYLSTVHLDYQNAFDVGAKWGDGIAERFKLPSLEDMFPDMPTDNISDVLDGIYENAQNTAGNTAAMANSLDSSDEDLQYLRDLAEREAINQFTTAEIVVDMGGITNQINQLDDLDGIVTRILDGVNEAVEIAAEGVHV